MARLIKSYPILKQWARLLDWRDLQRNVHVVPEGVPTIPAGRTIVWYTSGDYDDIALDINEEPRLQACVYAMRYRLYTGWHALRLSSEGNLHREAARLEGVLHRRWFATSEGRRQFRRLHPGYTGYTWCKLRLLRSAGH